MANPSIKTTNKTPTPAASKAAKGNKAPAAKQEGMVWDKGGAIKSARGVASYAFLTKADSYNGGDPMHKITVTFDANDAEFKVMCDRILSFENEYRESQGKKPVTVPSCVKVGEESKAEGGAPQVCFKVQAKPDAANPGKFIPVECVNAAAQPCAPSVWSGDIVRVVFSLGGWKSNFGIGAKPYLQAVQLLKANGERGTNAAGLFEAEPEFIGESETSDLPDEGEQQEEQGEGESSDEGGDLV